MVVLRVQVQEVGDVDVVNAELAAVAADVAGLTRAVVVNLSGAAAAYINTPSVATRSDWEIYKTQLIV